MATSGSNLDIDTPVPTPPPLSPSVGSRPPRFRGRPDDQMQPTAPPVVADGSEPSDSPENAPTTNDVEPKRRSIGAMVFGCGATFGSAVLHLLLFVVLGLLVIPLRTKTEPRMLVVDVRPELRDELDTFELEEQSDPSLSETVYGVDQVMGSMGGSTGSVAAVSMDKKMSSQLDVGTEVKVEGPTLTMPSFTHLITEAPEGMLGDPRAIVDDYDEAMDRITREILWLLAKSDVLVIWAFDQSESMKDDQQEIRDRINGVYAELGLRRVTTSDRLTSAVTSYGQGFLTHTRRPTSDVEEIRAAIDSVPIDPSGKEMMCSAVAMSIAGHFENAKKRKRQMMLVLVTDETGEKEDNWNNLETAVATAREANCRVYILGREAVFGYPYAHMKWSHPITGHVHWLPVDRGPETGFVEQLQTDGFRRRYDAHPSGFGPYSQTRLARETGGIFFMLPSLETTIVRGEKRRYELEAMRAYKPDLRNRAQLIEERDASALRSMLWKIIHDLNPYDKKVADVMEVDFHFPYDAAQFITRARREQAKIKTYLTYLDAAAKALEEIRKYRDQDPSPRWQANYDLIFAQVLAYTARAYEYGAYLDAFIATPKIVPYEKPGLIRHTGWDMSQSSQTIGGDLTKTYIDRSSVMFNYLIDEHPGTPWAARAQWELNRGFGWDLNPHYSYYGPRPPSKPYTGPAIPIPKL